MGVMNAALIDVQEYLSTSYEPDMEFINGILVERNVGSIPHSRLLGILIGYLQQNCGDAIVLPGARLLMGAAANRKYRIPDVMVVERPITPGKVVTDVPALTIEIISPDDRFDEVLEKCVEYAALRVPNVVVLDPDHKRLYMFTESALCIMQSAIVTFPKSKRSLEIAGSIFDGLDELRLRLG
jgi:Uma2 family endonuclease